MEHTFAEAYRRIREFIRREDPDGVIRMSGCQASTAYSGYDYYALHRHVGYFEAYGVGNQYEFHRSFAEPGTIIGGWFGYGAEGVSVKHRIWHALYHQLTLISIFWEYSCLNPDFTFSRSARDMSEVFREIRREGIGKLLLHTAVRDNLGIAIHYSMHAIHGTRALGDHTRFEANRQGWLDLLEDLGYQYQFVASQQIEAGELIRGGYKVLILPYSIALSDAEAEAITRFAENGGTVIGDFQTGLMDIHCRMFEAGKLDGLFGIERLTTDAGPFYINRGFRTNPDFRWFDYNLSHIPGVEDAESGLVMAEIGTREKEGTAAYRDDFMGTVASVVVREYGKGRAVYLNLALNDYPRLRNEANGGFALRELMKRVLGLTGAAKPAALETPEGAPIDKGCESFYYRDGEAAYVGVLKQPIGTLSTGHDGLAVGPGRVRSAGAETIAVRFARPSHVYDIRGKAYLGFTDRIVTEIASGDTRLFAALPHRVDGIRIEVPQRVKRGETLRAAITIDTGKPSGAYRHVLSIRLDDPDGAYAWIYSDNIAVTDASAHLTLNIPHNEKTGTWTLTVKDVATGISETAKFEIVPESPGTEG
jgi:hypothetical protein